MKSARIVLEKCMGLKKGETCLVLTDGTREDIAELFYDAAKRIADASIRRIQPLEANGQEPGANITKAMRTYDVILIVTEKSLSHTKARQQATDFGARIASMPGITMETLKRSVNVNYKKMQARTGRIADILDKGREARITTRLGTDLRLSIKGRNAHGRKAGIYNKPGFWGNLPDGEAFIAPVEGTAEGTYVVDASQAGIGKVDKPITIKVKKGMAYEIDNKELAAMLEAAGPSAYNIAEFGIGTNDKAKVCGLVLEDEKVLGTCHIALGSNFSFGGRVSVPIHVDGVMRHPDIFVDGVQVMKRGKFI